MPYKVPNNHIASLLASRAALGGTTRKSWADRNGIPSGSLGEIYNGLEISAVNRATPYVVTRPEIEQMRLDLHENFRRKKIAAVLFGVVTPTGCKYAIFSKKVKQ